MSIQPPARVMTETLGVILAGGQARRMGGGDKCLLTLGGKTLLARAVGRLEDQVDDIVLNANGPADRFAGTGLSVVPDSFPGFAGPLAGVLAGMEEGERRGFARIATVAADTPFFPNDLVLGLRTAIVSETGTDLAMAGTEDATGKLWLHPTFGLWPTARAADLRRALEGGTRKVLDWTDPLRPAVTVFAATPQDPFFNINRPGDLEAAERMLAGDQP